MVLAAAGKPVEYRSAGERTYLEIAARAALRPGGRAVLRGAGHHADADRRLLVAGPPRRARLGAAGGAGGGLPVAGRAAPRADPGGRPAGWLHAGGDAADLPGGAAGPGPRRQPLGA